MMYTDCYWLIDSLISFTIIIIIIIIIVFLIYSIVMYDCVLSIVHLKNKLNWTKLVRHEEKLRDKLLSNCNWITNYKLS